MTGARFIAASALMLMTHSAPAEVVGQGSQVRFEKQIRPILSEHCFACHGPDSESREAELRLDTRDGAMESGTIVPGNVKESELIARIISDDPDVMMPPPDARKPLKPEAKLLLARWIESGAEWEEHWAFVKPRKAELPRPAGVKKWARNPIDHFLLQKIRQSGLEPNTEADRHTLARRAALDLTGLPPAQELAESFLADDSASAFDRYVDALLTSEHAGEHRARYWLDAARYGDTHGLHLDNYREMWPYRDWVIAAFDSNMPFDRFVTEQIAGDLLPRSTLDQRIATGFNRCNVTTAEGGSIPEEVNVRYMVDRVETTATVFLGLTAGCAVCHDHKYDPISQREFYRLGAFFNNTTQPAMDGNEKDTPPVVALPDARFADEWRRLLAHRKELRTALSQRKSTASEWWSAHEPTTQHPVAPDGLVSWLPLTEGEGEPLELPDSVVWETEHPGGRRGVRFGDDAEFAVDLTTLRSDEPLTISFWFRTPDRLMSTTLFDQTTQTKDKKTVGWKITGNTQGALTFELADGTGKKIRGLLPGDEALRPRAWQHVCVRYSGGQSNAAISILVDGRIGRLRNASEELVDPADLASAPLKVASSLPTAGLSDLRIFRRWVSDEEVLLLGQEHVLKTLLASDAKWDDLDPEDRVRLTRYHDHAIDEGYRNVARELAETERRRDFIYARSTTTLVMRERSTAPRAWVLQRGEYDKRGDEVAPDVPTVLPALPESAPKNRLGLARWLVSPDHPLTARVTVNRLWQSVFGIGLVKTSEDFGVMGERPSHPELLDWLAVEFVESGWDVNHLLKLIVTSAAYRQNSVVAPDEFAKDPDNRLLARGPRLRLDAEVLRDQALAVSGLLHRDIGGPSVRPYQPAGLWKVVAITGSNTREFKQDSGAALYRRSLYTFWKRTSPPPSMAAFNAPTREQCTVRRERTNTPLQALVLMNDPQFIEAARRLAMNALTGRTNDRSRATAMLESVLCRPASAFDMTETLAAANGFRVLFRKQPKAAKELIKTGESAPGAAIDVVELAAWTMVANTLMNRDDFINKE